MEKRRECSARYRRGLACTIPTGLAVFHCASLLKQQSMDRHVAPLEHIILIPGKPGCALFLLNDACLEETQQIPIA
jgi:hypothetical protein